MNKENILRITLFVSVLAFNPATAQNLVPLTNIQTQQTTTVKSSLAKILHKRGLDEDSAEEISAKVIDDEELFALMLENLLFECTDISKEEVLNYLSKEALFRKTVSLESYDYLLAMISSIKQKPLDSEILTKLSKTAKKNRILVA